MSGPWVVWWNPAGEVLTAEGPFETHKEAAKRREQEKGVIVTDCADGDEAVARAKSLEAQLKAQR